MGDADFTASSDHEKKIELINMLKQVNVSAFINKWGPTHVLQIYKPEIDLHGILIIDNTVMGPACGSIEIESTITPYEKFLKARKMTWTCALTNTKFGGAAAGIKAHPDKINKIELIRHFARGIAPYVPDQYIAAPGTNVGEKEMAAFVDEIGDRRGATGKPREMGGIPYEMGMVGLGMGIAIETLIKESESSFGLPDDISGGKISILGYDDVGATLAKYLFNKGAKIVGICDDSAGIFDSNGLDLKRIHNEKSATAEKHPLANWRGFKKIAKEAIISLDCDILVCNSRDNFSEKMISSIKSKCVVEGKNGSVDNLCEQLLQRSGMIVLPDILTTSGGVIASYAEHQQEKCDVAFTLIEKKIREITKEVVHQSIDSDIPLRRIAEEIAKERILQMMEDTENDN